SGFPGKLLLIQQSFFFGPYPRLGYVLAVLGLATSLLTLLSMLKIWGYGFWSDTTRAVAAAPRPSGRLPAMGTIAALVVLALSVGLAAGQYLKVARVAARNVLNPTEYIAAVLGDDLRPQITAALAARTPQAARGAAPDDALAVNDRVAAGSTAKEVQP